MSTEEQECTEGTSEPHVPSFMCGLRHVEGYICTQRKDHTGVHIATGGDDFEPIIWPSARVWSLPAEPGPEVTEVRDRDGDAWNRVHADGWSLNGGYPTSWVDVLRFGPLTDATPPPGGEGE